ncbi:MAG TPA: flavodoxin domain-containing protein [Armatimonadota bacterium]|jgi:flavodoxin
MSKVLVVYCSMTGNTKAAAEAVAAGATAAGADVLLREWSQAGPAELVACDAVALGSYDAFSYIGGGLKDFFDRVFYPTQGSITDKPYAGFITHGGGGKAIDSLISLAASLKLQRAAEPVLVVGMPDEAATEALKALGAKLAGGCGCGCGCSCG